MLTESGYNFNDDDVQNIVGIVDSDATGEVDFEGFLALVSFLAVTKLAFDEVDTAQEKRITQQQVTFNSPHDVLLHISLICLLCCWYLIVEWSIEDDGIQLY